jgi:putative hydrolase of the HAD superfamily
VIRALIVDLDNTLYPARSVPRCTVGPILEAVRAANRAASLVQEDRLEEALDACWDQSFDQVARHYALPEPLRRAWALAAAQIEVSEPLETYPDVGVLWTLPLRLFLVTTGYRRFQESKIAALRLTERFEAIYIDALGESSRTGKEELFRRLLVEHHFAPAETVVLGDSEESEIAAGRQLGLWTIQVLRERVRLAPSAHWRIQSLAELTGLLNEIETGHMKETA